MLPIAREQALQLLEERVSSPALRKHGLATEAIMRALARRFGEDEDLWGITGLLHDLDLELIGNDMTRHGLVTCDILAERGFPPRALQAIKAHNGDVLGIECTDPFDFALTSAESMTGLISAAALVQPSRALADVKVKSIVKRMKEKRFAANVSRERIRQHESLGLPFAEFCALSIAAMQAIAPELGL